MTLDERELRALLGGYLTQRYLRGKRVYEMREEVLALATAECRRIVDALHDAGLLDRRYRPHLVRSDGDPNASELRLDDEPAPHPAEEDPMIREHIRRVWIGEQPIPERYP